MRCVRCAEAMRDNKCVQAIVSRPFTRWPSSMEDGRKEALTDRRAEGTSRVMPCVQGEEEPQLFYKFHRRWSYSNAEPLTACS